MSINYPYGQLPEAAQYQMLENSLPHNDHAETSLLGCVLVDNSLIPEMVESITAEDFYSFPRRNIFKAINTLYQLGRPVDPITVADILSDQGELEQCGGVYGINSLMTGIGMGFNIQDYIYIIKEKSRLRQLAKACNKTYSQIMDSEGGPFEEVLEKHESEVFQLHSSTAQEGFSRVGELAHVSVHHAFEIGHLGTAITGLATGFIDLDSMTLGFQSSDLIVIAGRPSMGKTALSLTISQYAAIHHQALVAFFSLEMSKQSIINRIICSESRIDSARYRAGFLNPEERERILQVEAMLQSIDLHIDDTPGIPVSTMRTKARRLSSQLNKPLDLIVVDYLQLMGSANTRIESRQLEVSKISRELKSLAKEFNVPLVALSQLSRASETRSNHRPQLSDLRESGAIEQDADVVAFIYREEEYFRTEENAGIAEIILAKQRNGPTGSLKLVFEKELTRFENMYHEHSQF